MLQIAVTGGIACGKSLVGDILSARGAAVRDTDDMAHLLLAQDNVVSRRVTEEFGTTILNDEGQIDRVALGNIVFEDRDARQRLNQIVHPAIKAMCRQWLSERRQERGIAALIVPLLHEAGMGEGWDAIICVACQKTTQIARLRQRGLSARQAEQRIAAQMMLRTKIMLADYVIFNEGDKSLLERQAAMVMDSILERNAW